MSLFDMFFSKSEKNVLKMIIFGLFLAIFCGFCKKWQKMAGKWPFLTFFDQKMTIFENFYVKSDKNMTENDKMLKLIKFLVILLNFWWNLNIFWRKMINLDGIWWKLLNF